MRIGSILHQFEHQKSRVDSPIQDSSTNCYFQSENCQIGDKRSLNVVMHSSPYLRCTQTAIAVSSGIAKAYDKSSCANQPEILRSGQQGTVQGSKQQEANSINSSFAAQSCMERPEFYPGKKSPKRLSSKIKTRKIKLRLDAFLGEWLTDDYFEHMYASPNATHLLETAKTDLLREPEAMDDCSENTIQNYITKENLAKYPTDEGSGQYFATDNLPEQYFQSQAHPNNENRRRSIYKRNDIKLSLISSKNLDPDNRRGRATPYHDKSSRSESIPQGIIDQARIRYVEVDSQWDSTKEPLLCGNGGELGEDWSSMHQRLTTGLRRLLKWHTNEESHNLEPSGATSVLSTEDYKSDTVLIIVTHGAACNALIGAFTNQPVVIDVDTSSFTAFVRKEGVNEEPSKYPTTLRTDLSTSPCDLSDIYDLKLLAATQHLQPGIDPTKIPYNPLIHPLTHSSIFHRPEDERHTGLMKSWNHSVKLPSRGVQRNIDNGSFQTFERVDLAPRFMNWNPPKSNLSPNGHITRFRLWSDLIFSPKGGCLEDASESSSEDDFLLNFSSTQHICKT